MRIWLIGTALVAAAGLAIWLLTPPPLFTSTTILHVSVPLPRGYPNRELSLIPGYQEYMARKVTQLNSDEVLRNAVSDPAWLACKQDTPEYLARFRRRLTVHHERRGAPIMVEFSDEDPESARVGLEAFTRAFLVVAEEPMPQEDIEFDQKVRDLKAKIAEAESLLEANEDAELQRECERMNYQLGNLVTARPWKPRFAMMASQPTTPKQ